MQYLKSSADTEERLIKFNIFERDLRHLKKMLDTKVIFFKFNQNIILSTHHFVFFDCRISQIECTRRSIRSLVKIDYTRRSIGRSLKSNALEGL